MTNSTTSRRGTTGLVDYWNETTRPLVSLFFVLPMLVAYEGGLLVLGTETVMRNGADGWLRQLLQWVGFGQYFLLPVLVCGILLAWHHLLRDKWRVRWGVMTGMYLEAALFGFLLLVFAQIQGQLLSALPVQLGGQSSAVSVAQIDGTPEPPSIRQVAEQASGNAGQFIAFLGAGIYEELLFRLMLLPVLAFVLRGLRVSPKLSWLGAVLLSSLLFSAAHFQIFTGTGDTWSTFRFVFRFNAGVFFAALFLTRGFGITAAAHAFYDVLATMSG